MEEKPESLPVASTAVELTTAALLAPPGTKTAAVVAVAAPKMAGALQKHWERRREKRRLDYVSTYLQGLPVEDEGLVEAEIQALADDPKLREIVFDSYRVLDDAMAEGAVFVMAKLTRLYRSRGLSADSFSRGVRRVMQDITAEDFDALREILIMVTSVRSVRESVAIAFHQTRNPPALSVAYFAEGGPQASRVTQATAAPFASIARTLELLKAGLLAQEGASRASDGIGGADHMFVELPKMRTLLDLMP